MLVGSIKLFFNNTFLHVFCNTTKSITNSSGTAFTILTMFVKFIEDITLYIKCIFRYCRDIMAGCIEKSIKDIMAGTDTDATNSKFKATVIGKMGEHRFQVTDGDMNAFIEFDPKVPRRHIQTMEEGLSLIHI